MINTKNVIFILLTLPWREAADPYCGWMATQLQLSPAKSQYHHRNLHLLPKAPSCGRSNPFTAPRIWDGMRAFSSNDYPWMAKMSVNGNIQDINCGGAIINEKYILTAGHCCKSMREGISAFFLGSKYISLAAQVVKVEQIIIHGSFTQCAYTWAYKNDICLVRVRERIQYSVKIKPICLPVPPSYGIGRVVRGETVEVAGWGKMETNVRQPTIMKVKHLTVLDNCQYTLTPQLDAREICVPAGICKGDSGSPLMKSVPSEGSRTYYIYGVASFTTYECEKGPSAFVRVTEYIDWVLDNLRP